MITIHGGIHMKKILISLYLVLCFYTLFHLIFNFQNEGVLESIFLLEADPLVFAVFNLLGLFPLAFLTLALSTNKLKILDFALLFSGFMLGGFVSTLYFIRASKPSFKPIKWLQSISILGILLTFMTIVSGLIFGSITTYIELFKSDSFIHIMTLDFIFMVFISPILLRPISKYYLLGLIPIIGIFIPLIIEKNIQAK